MREGDIIDQKFELLALLGAGGNGQVWRARDRNLQREVALKVLKGRPTDEQRRRFEREAVAAGRLAHPNTARVFGTGLLDSGELYITFELATGVPLSRHRGRKFAVPRVIAIAKQVCRALIEAHDRGVTHRDLKPSNIVIDDNDVVKVIDFGVAKLRDHHQTDVTKSGEIVGTPDYMSPEQLRAHGVGPATDQYALGLIVFEMLEGHLPFKGATLLETGMARLTQPAPPIGRPDCPPFLRECVNRALARAPEQRYPDIRAVLRALDDDPGAADVPSPSAEPRRNLVAGSVIAAFVLVGIASVLALTAREQREPVRPPAEVTPIEPRSAAAPAQNQGAPIVPDASTFDMRDLGPGSNCRPDAFIGDPPDYRSIRYIPQSYDSATRHRVLLFLTGAREDPAKFIRAVGLDELADKHKLVIVAPHVAELQRLKRDVPADVFEDIVRVQTRDLCVDVDRVVVVGQHDLANAALRLSCAPWVAALAHHARLRLAGVDDRCPNGRVVPELALTPTRSGQLPVAGGPQAKGCGKNRIRSLQETERVRRALHGCSDGPEPTSHPGGVCLKEQCDVPYRSCHIDGGIYWPGTQRAISTKTFSCEPAKDSVFPYKHVLDDFFGSLGD